MLCWLIFTAVMNQARSASVWCRAGISNIGIRGDDVLCRLRSELGPARPPGHPGPGSKGVRHRAERDTLPHCQSETTVSHLIQTKTCCDFNTYTISVAKATLEVQMSVCSSISLLPKTPNSLKSIISPSPPLTPSHTYTITCNITHNFTTQHTHTHARKVRVFWAWPNDHLCQIWLIYGHLWPDLWPNKNAGMAMAMVDILDFMFMHSCPHNTCGRAVRVLYTASC